jgi:hypothetical protein
MEIYLDRRAIRQIRLAAQETIEEGDTESLREEVLEAFSEEQVEEIERRLDTGDFFEFFARVARRSSPLQDGPPGRGGGDGVRRLRSSGMSLAMMLAACASPPATHSPPEGFDVQGHRGARGLLPENTLPAFARALELGVTTLELDVGMTRDGVVLLGHDPYLDPAVCLGPGGGRIEGERGPLLRDLDAAAVRAYDCGSLNPDPVAFPEPPRANRPGTPTPTLDEVLQLVAAHGRGGLRREAA